MSKSGGGGGLKGHDKGGGGSKVKLMKQQQSLESALDKVPDVILCPKEHRMKLHTGSKREGPLTCDGPDDICCGRNGDGVLEVGDRVRYYGSDPSWPHAWPQWGVVTGIGTSSAVSGPTYKIPSIYTRV